MIFDYYVCTHTLEASLEYAYLEGSDLGSRLYEEVFFFCLLLLFFVVVTIYFELSVY